MGFILSGRRAGLVHVGFVVDIVALRYVSLRFLLSTLFHRNSPYSHVFWGMGNRPVGISLVVINNKCFTATNALNVDSELPAMQVNYRCKFYSLYALSCAEAMINIKNMK
jgi:hypothetical protein